MYKKLFQCVLMVLIKHIHLLTLVKHAQPTQSPNKLAQRQFTNVYANLVSLDIPILENHANVSIQVYSNFPFKKLLIPVQNFS